MNDNIAGFALVFGFFLGVGQFSWELVENLEGSERLGKRFEKLQKLVKSGAETKTKIGRG